MARNAGIAPASVPPRLTGHPTAAIANLSRGEAEAPFGRIAGGGWTPADAKPLRPDADRDI